MTQKVTVGLQQKIGQPNFGSLGASCALEIELADEELADPRLIDQRIEQAYAICRTRIEQELAPHRPAAETNLAETVVRAVQADREARADRTTTQEAAETEIAGQPGTKPDNSRVHSQTARQPTRCTQAGTSSDGSSRPATEAQVRAICAIAPQAGVLLNTELQERFGVLRPGELTLQQASRYIDYLKAKQARLNRSLPVASPKTPSDDLSATDIQSADASA